MHRDVGHLFKEDSIGRRRGSPLMREPRKLPHGEKRVINAYLDGAAKEEIDKISKKYLGRILTKGELDRKSIIFNRFWKTNKTKPGVDSKKTAKKLLTARFGERGVDTWNKLHALGYVLTAKTNAQFFLNGIPASLHILDDRSFNSLGGYWKIANTKGVIKIIVFPNLNIRMWNVSTLSVKRFMGLYSFFALEEAEREDLIPSIELESLSYSLHKNKTKRFSWASDVEGQSRKSKEEKEWEGRGWL